MVDSIKSRGTMYWVSFLILSFMCRGLSPIYDCFPCQIFTFGRNSSDGSLFVMMDYQVGASNRGEHWKYKLNQPSPSEELDFEISIFIYLFLFLPSSLLYSRPANPFSAVWLTTGEKFRNHKMDIMRIIGKIIELSPSFLFLSVILP